MSYTSKYSCRQMIEIGSLGNYDYNECNIKTDLMLFMDEILQQIQREIKAYISDKEYGIKVTKTCTIKMTYDSCNLMDIPPIFENKLFYFKYEIKNKINTYSDADQILEASLKWKYSDNDKVIEFVRVKYEKLDAFIKTLIDLPKLLI